MLHSQVRALARGTVALLAVMGTIVLAGPPGLAARPAAVSTAVRADVGPASTVGPLLGEQRWYEMLTYQVSDRLEVLVNVANGNLVLRQKDLEIKGTGLDLKLGQHYNSLATSQGSVGNHWVLDAGADVRLVPQSDGSVVYFGPSGYSATFVLNSSGGYSDPPGFDATLVKNKDGSFTLGFHQSAERYAFSSAGRLTADVDRNGNAISFSYDGSGHLSSIADTQARTVSVASNSAGLIATITDPAKRTYGFTYDSGELTRYVDPAGGAASFAYSSALDLTQLTDPDGHQVRLTYDTSHRVTAITFVSDASTGAGPTTGLAYASGPGTGETTTTVTDPDQVKTAYTSDSSGRVTRVVDAQGHTSTASYTADDNPAAVTDALGNKTTLTYDTLNNPTGATLGNGARAAAAYGNANLPFQATSATDTQGNVTAYAYDGVGNLTQATDALRHLTKYAYNANGTQSSTTDATGNVTTYQHDSAGNLTGIFPNGLDYAYDGLSRVVSISDAKSQKTTNAYDALDRTTQVTYNDGTSASQTFDADGNRTRLVDAAGTTTFAYDTLGRLVGKTLPSGEAISLDYDGAGHLTSRHDNSGTDTYTYNAAGLPGSAKDPSGATTTFAYDAAHQPTSTIYPNGVTVRYEHDGANQITSIAAATSAATLLSRQYSYVPPGGTQATLQRHTVTDQAGAITSYGYDVLNRLTSAVVKDKSGSTTDSRSYSYDPIGNRTSQTINGTTTTYTYDPSKDTMTAGGVTYTYDADGNLVSRSNGYSWTYDAANFTTGARYVSPSCTGSACPLIVVAVISFTYAYSGLDQTQRVGITDDSGQTTAFAYDPTGLARHGDVSDLRDPGRRLLSEKSGSSTYYAIPDALDSTIGLTDGSGALVATWTYDPWGQVTANTGSVSTPFLFQGGYADFGGVYKMSTRYYDPGTGRYLQVDNQQGSVFDPQTLNRYLFQLDNPVNNPGIVQEQPTSP